MTPARGLLYGKLSKVTASSHAQDPPLYLSTSPTTKVKSVTILHMGGNKHRRDEGADVSPAVGRRVSRLKKRARSKESSREVKITGSNLCSLQKLDAGSIDHPRGAPTVVGPNENASPPSNNNNAIEPPSSQGEILSFIDALDHPISNMVEANEDLFDNNGSTLSSAFSSRDGNNVEVPQPPQYYISNSLVGKIAFPSGEVASGNETVAFPSTARPKAGREADRWSWMGGEGATRKSGDGTVIPLSMIQFPALGEEGSKGGSERTTEHCAPPAEQSRTRCVSGNPFPEFAAEPGGIAQHTATLKAAVSRAEIQKRDHNSRSAGRIRIISDRGATIREAFDIDESNFIVGKLRIDDERSFVEKRSLSPPIDDGESDEGCVNVMRYRIVLDRDDYNEADSDSLERDAHGRPVAWISDRGRLADDAYLILNELS